MGFGQLATFLDQQAARCVSMLEADLAKIGGHTQVLAAEYIGHEMPVWAPLSQATLHGFTHPLGFYIPGKIELGYTGHESATDPLLRKGGMRDSIMVEMEGLMVAVGSREKVALWQELGTHNPFTGPIPPRPFLALGMLHTIDYAKDLLTDTLVKLLTPPKV